MSVIRKIKLPNNITYDLQDAKALHESDVDVSPTESSTKVPSSGGTYAAIQDVRANIPTALADLTDDTTHRLVTDSDITDWNNKEDAITEVTYLSLDDGDTWRCSHTYSEIITAALSGEKILCKIGAYVNDLEHLDWAVQTGVARMHADVINWTAVSTDTVAFIVDIIHDSNDNISQNDAVCSPISITYDLTDIDNITCSDSFLNIYTMIVEDHVPVAFNGVVYDENHEPEFSLSFSLHTITESSMKLTLVGANTSSSQIQSLTIYHNEQAITASTLNAPTIQKATKLPDTFSDESELWLVDNPQMYKGTTLLPWTFIKCDELPDPEEDIVPITTDFQTFTVYYISSTSISGYMDSTLAAMYEVPEGFYDLDELMVIYVSILHTTYDGIISEDQWNTFKETEHVGLVIKHELYYFGWQDQKGILLGGPSITKGDGTNSIILNGNATNIASGSNSIAQGNKTIASALNSHAEGHMTTAEGEASHAEGSESWAYGRFSHAEGGAEGANTAYGTGSHAEGVGGAHAYGTGSHAEGEGTIAHGRAQHVSGRYNIPESVSDEDDYGQYAEIVGNGNNQADTYSNARTLDWSGNEVISGKLTIGVNATNSMDVPTLGQVQGLLPTAPGTLNTTATTSQSVEASEALSGNIILHKVSKTGNYADLLNTPTIPTVNNAVLTIQKNGTTVNTFTANSSTDVTANITVPTNTSDLTNDAGFLVAGDITSKANLASPAFTGTPTAPTAASGTNTTQIATTAFVMTEIQNAIGNTIGGAY